MKKVYSSMRAWVLNIIQLILPVIFLILAIIVGRSMKSGRDLPALDIQLSSYDRPITVMDGVDAYSEAYANYVNDALKSEIVDLKNTNMTVSDYILKKVCKPFTNHMYVLYMYSKYLLILVK